MRAYREEPNRERVFAQLFGAVNWTRTADEISKEAAADFISTKMRERQKQVDEYMRRKYQNEIMKQGKRKGRRGLKKLAMEPAVDRAHKNDQTFQTLKGLTELEKKEAMEVTRAVVLPRVVCVFVVVHEWRCTAGACIDRGIMRLFGPCAA